MVVRLLASVGADVRAVLEAQPGLLTTRVSLMQRVVATHPRGARWRTGVGAVGECVLEQELCTKLLSVLVFQLVVRCPDR